MKLDDLTPVTAARMSRGMDVPTRVTPRTHVWLVPLMLRIGHVVVLHHVRISGVVVAVAETVVIAIAEMVAVSEMIAIAIAEIEAKADERAAAHEPAAATSADVVTRSGVVVAAV